MPCRLLREIGYPAPLANSAGHHALPVDTIVLNPLQFKQPLIYINESAVAVVPVAWI